MTIGTNILIITRDWLNGYKIKTCTDVIYQRPTSELGTLQNESEGMGKGTAYK